MTKTEEHVLGNWVNHQKDKDTGTLDSQQSRGLLNFLFNSHKCDTLW